MYDNMLSLSDDKLAWLQSLPIKERAKLYAFNEKVEQSEEARTQRTDEIAEAFQVTANGDRNGLLDRAKFEAMMAKLDQSAAEKGVPN